ncbi:ROK family protein [Candidatus Saccharibacteria bacterium]|nr:ROK family protein [Candidatus Saccharibacteria bacterium]
MYLAVDIGGTKTLIALFSRRGRVIRRVKFKTAQKAEEFLKELMATLVSFQ